jgi:predicted AlkP superfamily phosphohydrolase/phosphomutase
MVVLGVDGMDPDILKQVIERYPERMPNFRWLIGQADRDPELKTSTPPQSPVAWSNFITGMNPAGTGSSDFIHRDPSPGV